MASRLERVAQRRTELRGQILRPTRNRRLRKTDTRTVVREIVHRLKLAQTEQTAKLQDRLAQAGFRSRDTAFMFVFMKAALPIVFGVIAFTYLYILEIGDLSLPLRFIAVSSAVGFGFFAADLYIANLTAKRQLALVKALPDGLDLLVICAESGLSLDAALNRVSEEIGQASPELAEELQITAVELGFLPDRRQALANLNRRTNHPAIRGMVNTLTQTEKYGTPLSNSLRVLANEFRDQRMLRAEEKAARLPATLTVPMIVFILPVLFIVLIGPAIIRVMDKM